VSHAGSHARSHGASRFHLAEPYVNTSLNEPRSDGMLVEQPCSGDLAETEGGSVEGRVPLAFGRSTNLVSFQDLGGPRPRTAVVRPMDRASEASNPRRLYQPLGEPVGELRQRASRLDPAVAASADVPRRGSDDVPTVASDVDAGTELSG